MKLSIVGTGRVGSTLAYSVVVRQLTNELVLVDRNLEVAEGECFDLLHAAAFTDHPAAVRAGDYPETAGSDIVVVCASMPWRPEYRSRLDLARSNAGLFAEMIPELVRHSPGAVLIVATNPVDVMAYHALSISGFPPARVIGTGTLLDSARFRSLLSEEFGVHPDDIRAYILGEHGDSQFPALSIAMSGGVRFAARHEERVRRRFDQAVRSGHEVFERKGYTNFGIAMATAALVESVVRDDRRTYPVSTLIDGYLGVSDVCLSVPCIVGRAGVIRRLSPDLAPEEQDAFRHSAVVVRRAIEHSVAGSRA